MEGKRIPATARGEATRRKLLEAAEAEFAGKGFHAASVSSITTRADIGQGTFYLYFHSKEEIFSVLVRELGHALRAHLAKDIGAERNRMQVERRGLEGFLQFTLEHPGVYRIVQEAQFVDEPAFRDYYQQLVQRYTAALDAAAKRGELSKGNAEERAWAMMGISHFLGLRHSLWSKALPPKKQLDDVMDFAANGMAPRKK